MHGTATMPVRCHSGLGAGVGEFPHTQLKNKDDIVREALDTKSQTGWTSEDGAVIEESCKLS